LRGRFAILIGIECETACGFPSKTTWISGFREDVD
jgi:hypothetical protein